MPKNLIGYSEAISKIDLDDAACFEEEDSPSMRKKFITQDAGFAKYYFPQALPFIRSDRHIGDKWNFYDLSKEFDFFSIMIYDSNSNTVSKDKYVIQRQPAYPGPNGGIEIWQGGDEDPGKAQISIGDVARVAQLYPSNTEAGKAAQSRDNWNVIWKQPALRVKIRDAFETVIFAPNTTAWY